MVISGRLIVHAPVRGDNRVARVVEASSDDTSDDSDAASSSVDFPSDSESDDSANMFGYVLLCRTCIAVLRSVSI